MLRSPALARVMVVSEALPSSMPVNRGVSRFLALIFAVRNIGDHAKRVSTNIFTGKLNWAITTAGDNLSDPGTLSVDAGFVRGKLTALERNDA